MPFIELTPEWKWELGWQQALNKAGRQPGNTVVMTEEGVSSVGADDDPWLYSEPTKFSKQCVSVADLLPQRTRVQAWGIIQHALKETAKEIADELPDTISWEEGQHEEEIDVCYYERDSGCDSDDDVIVVRRQSDFLRDVYCDALDTGLFAPFAFVAYFLVYLIAKGVEKSHVHSHA